jgi:hypothetical protein
MSIKFSVTVNGKKCEAIPVPEGITKPKELAVLFNCSYWAARGAIRRGYYLVNYSQKTSNPAPVDMELAYKMAWKVYHRKFSNGRLPWFIDICELVHVGAVAVWERAGEEDQRPIQWFFRAYSAMSQFIRRQSYLHRLSGDEDGSDREAFEGQRCKPSPDTWRRSQAATEAMVELIESKTTGDLPYDEPPEPEKFLRQKEDSQAAKERFLREILEAGEGVSQAELARFLESTTRSWGKRWPGCWERGWSSASAVPPTTGGKR